MSWFDTQHKTQYPHLVNDKSDGLLYFSALTSVNEDSVNSQICLLSSMTENQG